MDKTQEIMELREHGDTIREISRKTDVARATVHRIIQNNLHNPEDFDDQLDRMLMIHLPITYVCPKCGKEQRHAILCPLCGKFIPVECDDEECSHVEFDFSNVKINMSAEMKELFEKARINSTMKKE